MHKLFNTYLWIFFLLVFAVEASGQLHSYEEQIRLELIKRGIDANEFQLALIEEGIDPNDLQSLNNEGLDKIRIILGELELKSEQQKDVADLFSSMDTSLITIDTLLDSIGIEKEIIEDSLSVQIYGHQFFKNGQIEIIKNDDGYIPQEDYIIGRGDEMSIGIYGASRLNQNFLVQQDGSISVYPNTSNPQGNVRLFIGGMTMAAAREKLIKDFRRFYNFAPTQFTLGVNAIRQIRVQVQGEVKQPGEFVVSGLNSVANLIAAAGGFTDIGGVRQIHINKRDGRELTFDLYKMSTSPKYTSSFSLDNGDLIFVPAAQEVVTISGAIRRPHNYEIVKGEGIVDLVQYAGGLGRGAFLTAFDLNRYDGDRRIYKQIPYAEIVKKRDDFELRNGDEIFIDRIDEKLEDYVTVRGEVRNSGNFEFLKGMTVKDVLLLAELLPTARLDAAYIQRFSPDGKVNMLRISISDILNGVGTDIGLELQDKDEITIWSLDRFTDDKEVKISGAIRDPQSLPYDEGGNLRISDLIIMGGGLSRDAATYAHIHRIDPLNPQEFKYIRIDLERVLADINAVDNIYLEPFDSVHVYLRNEFTEDVFIKVSGAVNNPGTFVFGEGVSLRDAIVLAGGFKLSAATNQIEISRVIIRDNEPTRTMVEKVSLSRVEAKNFASGVSIYDLEPFDNVFVRYVSQFELQQNVTITGEVALPGEYSLKKENETVYDIIERAGGLTNEAFPAGATLNRIEKDLGLMVMRLDEVIEDPSSRFNYTLRDLDSLYIPKIQDYVVIEGYAQYLIQNGFKQVVAPFHEHEDAYFYVEKYAGGFAADAIENKIFVKYPNGEVKKTEKKFLFGKKHPPVVPGAIIQIGKKKPEIGKNDKEENVNWTKVLGDSVAQAMSILTLLLLIQRID